MTSKWGILPLAALLAGGYASSWAGPAEKGGLPPGFELSVFAKKLGRVRFMAFAPDGTLYVTVTRRGKVLALPDKDKDGKADAVITFAKGLLLPHGLAWRDPAGDGAGGWLYVGETHRLLRLRDTDGDLKADEQEVVVPDLPPGGMHDTHTIGFGPDGALYVSAGSSCDVCLEIDPRRATLLRYHPDGTGGEIYARGLRNAVGFTWHPETSELWATDNGRDFIGDDLPPEELNLVRRGDHHGWPYCFGDRVPDPQLGSPEWCTPTVPATFEMQAHSTPMGMEFYTGTMFPEEYRGDLFIAFRGSRFRSVPTGFKVVRVRFREGRPVALEDFVDVWFEPGRERQRHRPVDLKMGPDGALYISDDRGGAIFRLTYRE